ncbi:MAG: DUF4111 domain-containing protein [Chloroflexota bacterium]|jgi:hypothetical protein
MLVPEKLIAEVTLVCDSLINGLVAALGQNLYGIYLYGATVFPDSGPAQDIDCHVILNAELTDEELAAVKTLHEHLAEEFPPLGGELDAYYIRLEAARRPEPPRHQVYPHITDQAWALHCAHIRAGYYLTLYGPEPEAIFPLPSWTAVSQALEHELDFVRANLRYPAYCILNLSRILYSFQTRDVAVSKRACGRWAAAAYPEWRSLIEAALNQYDGRATATDQMLMETRMNEFLHFIENETTYVRSLNKNDP